MVVMDEIKESPAADLDRRIEILIHKIVTEQATSRDLAEYEELSVARANSVRPSLPERLNQVRAFYNASRRRA